jgi:hypothetical protein
MKAVPRWYQTLSSVLAVVFAVWVGMHATAPIEWLTIYTFAAIVTAALPAHRLVGVAGLAIGLVVAGWGGYQSRGAFSAMSAHDLFSFSNGVLSATREFVGIVVIGGWLIAGSVFRLLRE